MDETRDDPLWSIGTPNCPRRLVPMEMQPGGRGVWRCPECGLAKL